MLIIKTYLINIVFSFRNIFSFYNKGIGLFWKLEEIWILLRFMASILQILMSQTKGKAYNFLSTRFILWWTVAVASFLRGIESLGEIRENRYQPVNQLPPHHPLVCLTKKSGYN